MKFIYGLFLGCAFTVLAAVFVASHIEKQSADKTEAVFWERYDRKHAYAVLDRSAHPRERITNIERYFVSGHLPEDKIDSYMEFFLRGLNSTGGAVMVEGEINQYLEIAHRRGFEMKQIFADGYRAALKGDPDELVNASSAAGLSENHLHD